MDLRIHTAQKGIWIFINGKHKKTIPRKYISVIESAISNIDNSRKYLGENDRNYLDKLLFLKLLEKHLTEIQQREIHLYNLIAKLNPVAVRKVITRSGVERYELIYDNKLKIKIPAKLYRYFPVKEKTAHLNY